MAYDPYLGITAHYIDAPIDKPTDWELKSRTLAFTGIDGDHGGANMARIITRVVDHYGLAGNESIAGEVEVEDDEDWVHAMELEEPALEGEEVDEVSLLPQAKTYFATICKKEGLAPLQLIKWIQTRWGSMCDLIERLIVNCTVWVIFLNRSSKVPKLKGKKYADYAITDEEWNMLSLIEEVLKEPRDAQSMFSSENQPTVGRTIPTLETLQECWVRFASMLKFIKLKTALNKGLKKLKKYYRLVDQNNVSFINLALDPNFKLKYTKEQWDPEYYDAGMILLKEVFNVYAANAASNEVLEVSPPKPDSPIKGGGYGSTMMRKVIKAHMDCEPRGHDSHQELKHYLKSPLETVDDLVKWWGVLWEFPHYTKNITYWESPQYQLFPHPSPPHCSFTTTPQ
ncbi:ribonuclease H-like domain-containing protein [Suillus plorans]|uniref:Ribonuclease H-like domain-containing protein n=1 Tax=Suillus plorans TaxID=116603 RepID=A0A9P7DFU2_9AGAM|nr:ribonuclease H-like domain-containing protein [Suillus plorans]KAG1791155.1 ribonuclease H-like domain-containing protein [Suillus plorans]